MKENLNNEFSQIEESFNIEALTPKKVLQIFSDFLKDNFSCWIENDFALEKGFKEKMTGFIKAISSYQLGEISLEKLESKKSEAWKIYDRSEFPEKAIVGIIIAGLGSEKNLVLNGDEDYVAYDFFSLLFGYTSKFGEKYSRDFAMYLKSHSLIKELKISC